MKKTYISQGIQQMIQRAKPPLRNKLTNTLFLKDKHDTYIFGFKLVKRSKQELTTLTSQALFIKETHDT